MSQGQESASQSMEAWPVCHLSLQRPIYAWHLSEVPDMEEEGCRNKAGKQVPGWVDIVMAGA